MFSRKNPLSQSYGGQPIVSAAVELPREVTLTPGNSAAQGQHSDLDITGCAQRTGRRRARRPQPRRSGSSAGSHEKVLLNGVEQRSERCGPPQGPAQPNHTELLQTETDFVKTSGPDAALGEVLRTLHL